MSEPSTQVNISEPPPPPTPSSELTSAERKAIREQAVAAIRSSGFLPGKRHPGRAREIFKQNSKRLSDLERELYGLRSGEPTDDLQWLYDNLRLVRTDIHDLHDAAKTLSKLPYVRTQSEEAIPRCV